MRPQVFHDYVVLPVLECMGDRYNTKAARQLLLLTAAQESHVGVYAKQLRGPALGVYQIEPNTLDDIYSNFLSYNSELELLVDSFDIQNQSFGTYGLVGNDYYSTALARIQYWRDSKPMPEFDDIDGMWEYYKRIWNTNLGAATKSEFIHNWTKYVSNVDFS